MTALLKKTTKPELLALGLIVLTSFLITFSVSMQDSAIMDELAHIPAGYGYVRFLDFRLNPEHPPLLKVLSSLPLLFQNLNFPTNSRAWQSDINGQWEAGTLFIYQSGNDADLIINWARVAPILITLLLTILIYIWSKELLGRWWAILPTALFAFSPNILAHSHYVTTDVAAAFGVFFATYFLIKYLMNPSSKRLGYAGLAFGVAQLMKFSAVLLIPYFIFLIIVFYLWKARMRTLGMNVASRLTSYLKLLPKAAADVIFIFLIGFALVYALYFIFTINYPMKKQIADTEFILTSFAEGPDPGLETCKLSSSVSLARRARCLAEINIALAKNPITRPFAEYMLGVLMVMQRSSGGNTSYFLGEVSASGWWYYFPVVFLLKEPLPSLILILFALIFALGNTASRLKFQKSKLKTFTDYLGTNFAEFAMLVFVIFYWLYSIKSPLNIGVRHIFPTLPFIYILTAASIKKWMNATFIMIRDGILKTIFASSIALLKSSAKGILLAALIIWYLAETALTYPNFLSYFNQFGGGKWEGYRYVVDSNYDWGQDLKRLKNFLEERNLRRETKIDKIAVDYFGGGNPKYYLGNAVAEYWGSSRGDPRKQGIEWLAISINNLQGAKGQLHPGQARKPEDEYQWLKDPYKPYARAGTTIFIYKL